MNKAAQTLGKLAAGKPKQYSKAELKRKTKRLLKGRAEWLLKKGLQVKVSP